MLYDDNMLGFVACLTRKKIKNNVWNNGRRVSV